MERWWASIRYSWWTSKREALVMLVSRMDTWRSPQDYVLLPPDMPLWTPTSDSPPGVRREEMEMLVPMKATWHTLGYHPPSLFGLADLYS
ncbi:hypothetical protein GJ744_005456 [Endocarpon pusillum]|uniref:Uncharacterized protein n=1 Tax=Endocarpon pusillum TaxID=364733 RepID=A0A8H7A8Q3_9EURO|nr:hypothetical protein GJ744_005456 [Endocarpon pusillum]